MIRRLLDFVLLCAVSALVLAVAAWLWPTLGPVAIAAAVVIAVVPANLLYLRRSRPPQAATDRR